MASVVASLDLQALYMKWGTSRENSSMSARSELASFTPDLDAAILELQVQQQQQQQQHDPDSDLYDTDVEGEQDKKPSGGRYPDEASSCVAVYLMACERQQSTPYKAIIGCLGQTQINLRHRSLSSVDIRPLALALSQSSSAEKLDLSGNDIGGRGASYLNAAMSPHSFITHLDISHNRLSSSGAVAVGDMLRRSRTLLSLNLSGNDFQDKDMVFIASGLMANGRLCELDLSRNSIGELGGLHLGRAFARNSTLDILDISWNNIRLKGAVALIKGIQENTGLTRVNLSWNGLGYEGSLAAGELLKFNSSLLSLDLSNNRINWQGVEFIAKGLRKNTNLEVLTLDDNPLTTTGCMDIIEAISESDPALHTLSLKGVSVIGEFNLMVMMIKQSREFTCTHGGVVGSHDKLGERPGKRITPIEKVIQFMKERELRPVELFRMLDKDVSKKLSNEELIERLHKIGITLPKSEMYELLFFIQSQNGDLSQPGDGAGDIKYKTMAASVQSHARMERGVKTMEMERQKKLRNYHKNILTAAERDATTATEPLVLPRISTPDTLHPNDLLATPRVVFSLTPRKDANPLPQAQLNSLMSMSTALGAKAKAFGAAETTPKKKKKKKEKK